MPGIFYINLLNFTYAYVNINNFVFLNNSFDLIMVKYFLLYYLFNWRVDVGLVGCSWLWSSFSNVTLGKLLNSLSLFQIFTCRNQSYSLTTSETKQGDLEL